MRPLLRIAKTEVLEHRRQPAMLFILAANYLLFSLVFGVVFFGLDVVMHTPALLAQLQQQTKAMGVELDTALRLGTSTSQALAFTNLPLFVAVLSGTSVLHDRECGTLPFLMLAPMTRFELLAGKLLGVMVIPLGLHVVLMGAASLLFGSIPALAPEAHKFGGGGAFWVAFFLGAPASAAFVGALGTIISARSHDIRTSMQFTSFFIGLLSLGIGAMLVDALPHGVGLQVTYAAAMAFAAFVVLVVGARTLSRDVEP